MAETGRDVVREAIEHLDRGEDEQALALLGPHVVRHPDDLEALYRLGIAYARTQRLHDALRMFSRVLEADPNHGLALWSLGRTQLVLENPHAAEPLLRLALLHAPEHAELWADHAVALRTLGRARDSRETLDEACRRFPEDVYLKARLLALELQDGALEAAARTADRIEANHPDDPVALASLLQCSLDPPQPERARRAAATVWREQAASLLDYDDLLRDVAVAFPPAETSLVRTGEESQTCPACGTRTLRRDIVGLVLSDDPLERLAAIGAWLGGNRCACGLQLPGPARLDVIYPDLSLALRVDGFPSDETRVSAVSSLKADHFGAAAAVWPRAEVWFAIDLSGPGAYALALEAEGAALAREASLPDIGELGRAERRARETATALTLSALAGDEEGDTGESERPPLPDWLRIEREGLLASGIACGPWPLDHRCACGADLTPFLFGASREALFDPEAVDEAAIAGVPLRDPEGGATVVGFNCDACGRLHTWILGILPPGGAEGR